MNKTVKFNEKLLIGKVKIGNEVAFKLLFDHYQRYIYAYSLSLLKSKPQAQEVVQDVFLNVWLNRERLDPSLSFKSYIFTIARNMAFNFLEKAANDLKLRERIFYKSQLSNNFPDTPLIESDYKKLKDHAIRNLSPRCKQVFQMSRNDGKSYQEIAQELNISSNTVKNQMSKALANIKEFLIVHGDVVFLFVLVSKYFQD
jgi:RNA polymerase sigma-70 factor (ECF subfamily)